MNIDYTKVTEVPGSGGTGEQLERLRHRYGWAKGMAQNRRVLEVACGAGFGFGSLESVANSVVGGDYTFNLLRIAHSHYGQRIPLVQLDGGTLPFSDNSFDTVLIFEALYYLPNVESFVLEVHRVLTPGGRLLIASANREWDEFAPSPHSTDYLSARELVQLLSKGGFTEVECLGVFPTGGGGVVHSVISLVRRLAVTLHLMPRTLEGRARLKRLVYGELEPLPPEIATDVPIPTEMANIEGDDPVTGFKVLYCSGVSQ